MVVKCLILFLLIATPLWAENTIIPDESDSRINAPLPTFKETQPISAEDVLSTGQFQQGLYEESQGFSQSAYWHKLSFPKIATPNTEKTIYLGLNYYVIEHLDFYLFHGNQLQAQWKRGALENWQGDTKHYDGIWMPISLSDQQDTTLLIRKQGDSPLLTPFMLFDDATAEAKKEEKLIFWTFIISSLSILFAHNIFVFILLRQLGFIYYLGLNIVIFIALSVVTGFDRWIFSEEICQWIIRNLFTIFGIGAWILFRFSLHFLKEVQIPSPQSLIRKYGDLIFIAFLLSTQLFSVKTGAILFALVEVFMFVACTYWGIKAYQKGFLAVRFYLFSWLFLIAGSILNTLIFWKVLPINLITESILPVSSLLQLLGFSFALADKAKQIERTRKQHALTDLPTGLPNRTYYFDKLPKLLSKMEQHPSQFALILVDISNYQTLSEAFGPAKVDSAMSEAIRNIHKKVINMKGVLSFPWFANDTQKLVRVTAKNLVMISTIPDQLHEQIKEIQEILDDPTLVDTVNFRHQYKIGSALYPSQGTDLDKLYQNALIANNSVTYSSGNWAPFTENLNSNHAHQLGLITRLADDIQHEKLYFHIQPQINLVDHSIIGGEILVRWHNEHLGQVSPAEFIPLAEQTGLIYKLTDMLLEKVFHWASEHPKALMTQRLSVNISALDLLQEDFAKQIMEKLHTHQLTAHKFTIEITETSIFQNNDIVHNNVKQLHHAGFKLALDDFGVGYSSMQNLVALETDELKIDQFFVMNLLNDPQSQTLCHNMINLCKALNIISVAEGIESEEILQLLQQWRCQVGQGYHLYRPMSPTDYLELLDRKVPPLSAPINRA
ncbi:EAL domain-containing protein [Marinomonas sp.]|uniref:EAL domain-containing protein n=1 Tax=Marinomonas sp. TaxID=1904862 RepID=UPI003BAA78FD